MAKQTNEQKLMRRWWVRLVLALIFAGIAYGFASLAIDSGSLAYYALAIFFIVWAIVQIKNSAHYLISR